MSRPTHPSTRVLIAGAGPHALTILQYLATVGIEPADVTVVDPRPWLAAWRSRFAAHDIPMLRSSRVHHPHPDPHALMHYARDRGRSEFYDGIGRPGSGLFDDFCDHLLDSGGWRDRHVAAVVRHVRSTQDGCEVDLSTGTTITSQHVIVAVNPIHPDLPARAVAHGLQRRRACMVDGRVSLGHGDHVELSLDVAAGQRVLVIGGGLTAAQLALGAARRGAAVTLAHRSTFRTRDLDVEPTWLGRDLEAFHRAPPVRRPTLLAQARGGGSIPPRELGKLRRMLRRGRMRILEQTRMTDIDQRGDHWVISLNDQGAYDYDSVWLATGHRIDAAEAGFLTPVLRRAGSRRGLASLTHELRIPGTQVHVSGGLAGLHVGPTCRTLIGARMAAERMLPTFGEPMRTCQYPGPTGS